MGKKKVSFGCSDIFVILFVLAFIPYALNYKSSYGVMSNIVAALMVAGFVYWWVNRRGWLTLFASNSSSQLDSVTPINAPPSVWYTIKPGRIGRWEAQNATALVKALLAQAANTFIDFRVEATHDDIRFTLLIDPGYLRLTALQGLVQGLYPDAEVENYELREPVCPLHQKQVIFSRSQQYPFFESLKSPFELKSSDPLVTLTQIMDSLQAGERLTYSVSWVGNMTYDIQEVNKLLTVSKLAVAPTPRYYRAKGVGEQIVEDLIQTGIDWRTRVPAFSDRQERDYRAKLTQPLYMAVVSVVMESPDADRLHQIHALSAIVSQFNYPDCPLVEKGHEQQFVISNTDQLFAHYPAETVLGWARSAEKEVRAYADRHALMLTADELATLWHLPHEGFTASHIQKRVSQQVQLPKTLASLTEKDGVLLGLNRYGQQTHPVYLPHEERTQHTAIIGKTGTGKSTLLHQLIRQDIAAGLGVCVIDPAGNLVRNILQESIPTARENDVVVLDMATPVNGVFYPPPLNLLNRPSGLKSDRSAQMLVSVLSKIYKEFRSSQMAYYLQMALITLAQDPQATLLDIPRIFNDLAYRDSLTATLDNLAIPRFWNDFDTKSSAERNQDLFPLLRRLDTFYSNTSLMTMTCHPHALDLRQLIAGNKIMLVSLAADTADIGELERQMLGATLVSQIEMAVMAGAISQTPFMLYIDEAQNFVTTALPEMLSEARQKGLGLVLSNQFFKQMVGETREAIEGNVATLIAFEIGEGDASDFSIYTKPQFTSADLVSLGKYRAAVSLRHQNSRPPAFSLETQPLIDVGDQNSRQQREASLRARSVANYTPKPYSEVLAWLKDRYTPPKPSVTLKKDTDEFIEPNP